MEMRMEKETLRANLLRTISHDLRTPLTSISGDADMLLHDRGALSAQQKVPVSWAGGISAVISMFTIVSALLSDRMTLKFGAGKIGRAHV